MGIETIALAGLAAYSAYSANEQGQRQAKADVAAGNIRSNNLAVETKAKADNLTTSFLSSGLTLEGTPMNVIQSAYSTGIRDINQNIDNTNTKAKNDVSAGRTKALESLAGSAIAFAAPGVGSMFGDSTTAAIDSLGTNFTDPFTNAAGEETFNPAGTNFLNYLK